MKPRDEPVWMTLLALDTMERAVNGSIRACRRPLSISTQLEKARSYMCYLEEKATPGQAGELERVSFRRELEDVERQEAER